MVTHNQFLGAATVIGYGPERKTEKHKSAIFDVDGFGTAAVNSERLLANGIPVVAGERFSVEVIGVPDNFIVGSICQALRKGESHGA